MGWKSPSTRLEELEEQLNPVSQAITGAWTAEELEAFRAAGYTIGAVAVMPKRRSPAEWQRMVREHQRKITQLATEAYESLAPRDA